jgi:transposase-like protein
MNEDSGTKEIVKECETKSHGEKLPVSPEEKAQWVKRFMESGLSIRKFSATHDIPRMSLWAWVDEDRRRRISSGTSVPIAAAQFTEIKLPPPVNRCDWAAELTLPNGTVLRLSKDVPTGMLDQLLRVC